MRPAVRRAAALLRPPVQAIRSMEVAPRLTIIGWHRIDSLPDGLSTPVDVFHRQLDALEQWGATVLGLDDAVRRCRAGSLPPRAVALTFDDGYASVIETAWPSLSERHLPATLFAVSGYLDGDRQFPWDQATAGDHARLSTADELRDAARQGLDIGSHTATHPWLPRLGAAELERELVDSRAALEDVTGRPVTSIAYPTGGWDAAVRAAAAEAGYDVGVTCDRGRNSARHDRLALRRAFAPDTVRDFDLLLDGAYTWLRPFDRWRTREGAAS
jgi:peptidoglycan/xylan/chitin deacetylase (PgdA/CDA1 family)